MMDNMEKEPLKILYTSIVHDRGVIHLRTAFSSYIKVSLGVEKINTYGIVIDKYKKKCI